MTLKQLALSIIPLALSLSGPVYGSACSSFLNDTVAEFITASGGSCTVGAVTLSGFNVISASPTGPSNSNTSIAFGGSANGAGTTGFVNVGFQPAGGSTVGYTVSYNAMCSGCSFTSLNDDATANPVNSGIYTFLVGSAGCSGTTTQGCNVAITGSNITNSGQFIVPAAGATNIQINLDLNFSPTSSTPEPTSMLLFGSGFLALGLIARAKRGVRNR